MKSGVFKTNLLSYTLIICSVICTPNQLLANTTNNNITATIPKSFPPYYTLDENGQPDGFAIDILEAIAQETSLNITYDIKDSWDEVFSAATNGEVELIPNLGKTAERTKHLAFTQPVATFNVILFTRKNYRGIQKNSDIPSKKIGAVSSNAGYKIATNILNTRIESFDTFEQAVYALLSGRIDGLAYPDAVAWKLLDQADLTDQVDTPPIAPLAEIKRAMAVKKGNIELLQTLDDAIATLITSNEYKLIRDKWFKEPPPFWTKEKIINTLIATLVVLIIFISFWRYSLLLRYNKKLDSKVEERTTQLKETIKQHEITELKLTESESRLTHLLVSCPVVIYTREFNNDFPTTYISPNVKELFGHEPEHFLGNPSHWADHIHAEDKERVLAELKNASQQDHVSQEYRFLHKNESYIWVYDEFKLVRDKNGNPISLVGYWTNISSRKQAELDLIEAKKLAEKANMAKTKFLANMSHEFRTPLHGILAYAEMGLQKLDPNPEKQVLRKYFNQINTSGERLKRLVNDLLDISKLEAGKMTMHPVPCSVTQLINRYISEQHARLARSTLSIDNTCQTTQLITCDEERIYQVINNIIGNAMRFAPENTTITINCSSDKLKINNQDAVEAIRISISDCGPGVPPGEEDVIFKKFEQSSQVDYHSGGTGLGLAICKEIIEAHSGKIWYEPNQPNGAIFHFVLPITFQKERKE